MVQGAEPDAAFALATVDAGVVGRPVAAVALHIGGIGVTSNRESKYSYLLSSAVTCVKAGSLPRSSRPVRGGAFKTTKR